MLREWLDEGIHDAIAFIPQAAGLLVILLIVPEVMRELALNLVMTFIVVELLVNVVLRLVETIAELRNQKKQLAAFRESETRGHS